MDAKSVNPTGHAGVFLPHTCFHEPERERAMNQSYLASLGKGIYTDSEAARLTGVRRQRIHRWARGYEFQTTKGERHASRPVLDTDRGPGNSAALEFLDLMDVRVVNAFRNKGISWSTLRTAAALARERFGVSHPFSDRRFKTDGKNFFLALQTRHRQPALIDLLKDQFVFPRIVEPFLLTVEFDGDTPCRWFPLGKRRHVVIDPDRSFGQPITREGSVATYIVAAAVRAEGSMDRVARWYEIPVSAVRDAVAFEEKPAA